MKLGKIFRDFVRVNREHFKDLKDTRRSRLSDVSPTEMHKVVHMQGAPCFVLSTGRSGTLLLTEILRKSANTKVYHSPIPELEYYSKFAYSNPHAHEILKHVVDSARYELIRDTYLSGKQYVETNNRITFFAHQLAELYPKSRFIHLVREPKAFIKSGMGRNWYQGNFHDEGRIVPIDGEHKENWNTYSQVQKIAWLWNETNEFIESFKVKYPDRIKTVRAEDMFSSAEKVAGLLQFMGSIPVKEKHIEKLIKRPVNKGGKKTNFTEEYLNLVPLRGTYYS